MKTKKHSLRYWVKSHSAFDWDQLYPVAVEAFVREGAHPEVDFDGTAIDFANQLHQEHWRRGKPYCGAYFTPPAVARDMVRSLGVLPGMIVLDPAAGCGNLLWAVQEAGGRPTGVEWQGYLARAAQVLGFDVAQGDYLQQERGNGTTHPDAVIINPPFGRQWDHADIAVEFMRVVAGYGVPVAAILPRGWLDKTQRKYLDVRERYRVVEHEDLPDGTFAPLTGIATTRYLLEAG